ncbi:hypothetical protein SJAV_09810 [Sulfurisphaera javensis]|uniref:Uncharacterized protein n=1 Tax=Sulfurisphaera javensis TaxID=2049879 RepID=A0AAT9GQB6_9CREN
MIRIIMVIVALLLIFSGVYMIVHDATSHYTSKIYLYNGTIYILYHKPIFKIGILNYTFELEIVSSHFNGIIKIANKSLYNELKNMIFVKINVYSGTESKAIIAKVEIINHPLNPSEVAKYT